MIEISKKKLLEEKPSGTYKCPHFVPPTVAEEIANSVGFKLDVEAAKSLAEISENFALEILKSIEKGQPATKENIISALNNSSFSE